MGWVVSYLIRLKYCGGVGGLITGAERKMLEQHLQFVRTSLQARVLDVEDEPGQALVVGL